MNKTNDYYIFTNSDEEIEYGCGDTFGIWLCPKDYWNKNHCIPDDIEGQGIIDDGEKILFELGFSESMESYYTIDDDEKDWKSKTDMVNFLKSYGLIYKGDL